MPFWTVEDAGPYKEKSNFLMRSPLIRGAIVFHWHLFGRAVALMRSSKMRVSSK